MSNEIHALPEPWSSQPQGHQESGDQLASGLFAGVSDDNQQG